IQAIYDPSNPRFRNIHRSMKATVANTHRLTRPNPIAPVTIDLGSDGRGLASVNIWYADGRSGCKISSICRKYSSQNEHEKTHQHHNQYRSIDDHHAHR